MYTQISDTAAPIALTPAVWGSILTGADFFAGIFDTLPRQFSRAGGNCPPISGCSSISILVLPTSPPVMKQEWCASMTFGKKRQTQQLNQHSWPTCPSQTPDQCAATQCNSTHSCRYSPQEVAADFSAKMSKQKPTLLRQGQGRLQMQCSCTSLRGHMGQKRNAQASSRKIRRG